MALELFTDDVEVISKLGDDPNIDDGLSADGLKTKFDEGSRLIKKFLNEKLIPAVNDCPSKTELPAAIEKEVYAEKELTEDQQAQARANIGAAQQPVIVTVDEDKIATHTSGGVAKLAAAGRTVMLRHNNVEYQYTYRNVVPGDTNGEAVFERRRTEVWSNKQYIDIATVSDDGDTHFLTVETPNTIVQYTEQALTPNEQAQARANIGAASADLIAAVDDSSAIVAEATGSAITLKDASNRPLRGLTIYGKTTQAETPTKDDPMEMVDVGRRGGNIAMSIVGKNRLPYPYHYGTQTVNGITFTDNGDGSVTANGTAAGNATYYLVHHDNPIYLSVGETYTVSGSPAGAGANTFKTILQDITYSQGANDEGAGATLTAKYTAYYAFIRIMSGTTVNNVTFRPMVEEGAAATDPERYSAQHLAVPTPGGLPGLPVTSGGNYTDESGQQWTCDAKDLGRGVHIKQISELMLTGEEQWFGNTASYAGWVAAQIAVDAMPNSPVICTHYEGVAGGMPKAGQVSISNAGSVIIKDADFGSDKTALAAYIAAQYADGTPVKIRYALAEPVETPMDEAALAAYAALHTNKPNTTILNDAGAGMKVEYVADTKAYIDNKFAALTAAIMNT